MQTARTNNNTSVSVGSLLSCVDYATPASQDDAALVHPPIRYPVLYNVCLAQLIWLRLQFAFSIKSQFGTNPSKLKSERLVLAFETSDEAQKWLEAIADRVNVHSSHC